MKKKEIIFFGILFAAALAAVLIMQLAPSADNKTVLITVDGEEYKRINIDEETYEAFTIETEHGVNNVVIEHGYVNVISADCPTQICVNTKEAYAAGDIIVCLPHKVVIEIVED
jgi:hypothetical protein